MRTKTVAKSAFAKNTHYSGILRRLELWLQPVTPWRVYFPAQIKGGRLSAQRRKAELIDRLDLPKRLRQLSLGQVDRQPNRPMNEETSMTNWSQSQCRRSKLESDEEVGGIFLFFFPTVTPHCRISTHRSPRHSHRNTQSPQRAPSSEKLCISDSCTLLCISLTSRCLQSYYIVCNSRPAGADMIYVKYLDWPQSKMYTTFNTCQNIGTVAKFNPLVYNKYSGRMTKLMHFGNRIEKLCGLPRAGKKITYISAVWTE